MKRIESLIQKLNKQFEDNAPLSQLLVTVQMIEAEITGSMKEVDVLGATGVSVIAPVVHHATISNLNQDEPINDTEKEFFELVIETDEDDPAIDLDAHDATQSMSTSIPTYEEVMQEKAKLKSQSTFNFNHALDSDTDELPTLSRQTKPTAKVAKQAATPRVGRNAIKDLQKAINAKDRLIYIKALFRGDEVMFDRSVKTINNFNNLAEAEYWIMRELKTKNGWLPQDAIVQQFEQLVRRRFA